MFGEIERAKVYMAYGYRRVSNRHSHISRIDELNWRRQVPGRPRMDDSYGGWEDHYRRCYSKDVLKVPRITRYIASSSGDHIGYVNRAFVYMHSYGNSALEEARFAWSLLNSMARSECLKQFYEGAKRSRQLWPNKMYTQEFPKVFPAGLYSGKVRKVDSLTNLWSFVSTDMDFGECESRVVSYIVGKQEESKMLQVKRRNVWTDGRDVEHVISEMSDDYVRNCTVYCQNRLNTLEQVNEKFDSKDVRVQIKRMNESIEMFVAEIDYRRKKGIEISRVDGCEEHNRNCADRGFQFSDI